MAFKQVIVRTVENGFMVSVTKDELSERGYIPIETHFIAPDLDAVLKIVGVDKKPVLATVK